LFQDGIKYQIIVNMFNVCIFQHDVIQIHMNYQGGDIGCGFCKYDITTADIDNLKYTYMIID